MLRLELVALKRILVRRPVKKCQRGFSVRILSAASQKLIIGLDRTDFLRNGRDNPLVERQTVVLRKRRVPCIRRCNADRCSRRGPQRSSAT